MDFPKWFMLFLCFSQLSFGQNLLQPVQKIPLKVERFEGVDPYGNLYFFEKTVFHKTGKDGDFQYNDLQLGKPTHSDLTNPLKIVLFYEAMNTVVFLDQHLIEIRRVNFNQLQEFKTIHHASVASGDKIWLFNIQDQKLEVFDYTQKKVVANSQPIHSKILGFASNFNFCWVLTTKFLKKYNTYGSLLEKTANPGFEELAAANGNLMARKADTLFLRRKNAQEFEKLSLPKMKIEAFYLTDKKLYIYDGEFLNEFHLN